MVDILKTQINLANNMDTEVKLEDEGITEVAEDKPDDGMEDGELPEEGEITEDEDEPIPEPSSDERTQSESRERSSRTSSRLKQSSQHSRKPASKYRDFDRKHTKSESEQNTMMDSWLSGVQKKGNLNGENDEFGLNGKNDEEYGMDEFGVADSPRRTRRRSNSPDEHGIKRARMSSPGDDDLRRGPMKSRWTERTICKFFREGFCRDGDDCVYSHNAVDSHRKPELCRFYFQGYCRRGLACQSLHGEFPCKAFHKGECSREPCQFSHRPLDDFTKPLYENMVREEESISSEMLKERRRVLLPDGPAEWDQYPVEDSIYDDYPAPAIIPRAMPVNQSMSRPPAPTGYGFFNAIPTSTRSAYPVAQNASNHHPSSQYSSPPLEEYSSRHSPPQEEPPFSISEALGTLTQGTLNLQPANTVSPSLISDSLQSLQSMFNTAGDEDYESPASPPSKGLIGAVNNVPVIPTVRPFVAIPLILPDPSGSLDLNLIQQITSGLYKNDPRVKKMAEKQFDIVSRTLEQQGFQQPLPETKPSTSQPISKPLDPRSRDPRTARAVEQRHSASPSQQAAAATVPTDSEELDHLVAQQIKMMAQQQAQQRHTEDVDMRGPQPYEKPESAAFYGEMGGREAGPPFYDNYHTNRGHGGRGRFRGHGGPRGRRDNRFKRDFDEDPRNYQREDRWNVAGSATSPSDSAPDHSSEGAMPPAAISLREKRKHNEYESPLARPTRF